jgi:hypothetical protein
LANQAYHSLPGIHYPDTSALSTAEQTDLGTLPVPRNRSRSAATVEIDTTEAILAGRHGYDSAIGDARPARSTVLSTGSVESLTSRALATVRLAAEPRHIGRAVILSP